MFGEDDDGGTPTVEGLQEWADTYGSQHPLVIDPGYGDAWFLNGGLPSMATLATGAVIVSSGNSYDTSEIEGLLPDSETE